MIYIIAIRKAHSCHNYVHKSKYGQQPYFGKYLTQQIIRIKTCIKMFIILRYVINMWHVTLLWTLLD